MASSAAVPLLALSKHVSFHARGEAAFAWHGLTGDVAEMSREVLALLLAFDPPADATGLRIEGIAPEQLDEFTGILRARRFLVSAGATDEIAPLLAGYPRVPRSAVFERTPHGVTLYTRAGNALVLDAATARLFLRCDGEKTLAQVVGDDAPQSLLELARPEIAALKILAKPVSRGGVHLNPAAESTMPFPRLADPRAYAEGAPAPAHSADPDVTFASLFDDPHPALRNRTYAQAVAAELQRHTDAKKVLALGMHLENAGHDLAALTPDGAFDAIVVSEIACELGFSEGRNAGAIALVRDACRALRPGGVLFVADFGDPKAAATPQSVCFADLQDEASRCGLEARVVPLAEALDMDLNLQALSTTKASWPAIRALFKSHGIGLKRRAWLRSEIEHLAAGRLDLAQVHGLLWAPLSERALGLAPRQFWALIAKKPQRAAHGA